MKKPTHYRMRKVITDPGNGLQRTDDTRVPAASVENYQRKGYVLIGPDDSPGAHVPSKGAA